MIRKLASGGYRLYSRKVDPKTGRRRNLGTFKTRAAAEKHERAVQYFKRHSGDASEGRFCSSQMRVPSFGIGTLVFAATRRGACSTVLQRSCRRQMLLRG
jgi:hypothetical protein